MMCNYGVVVPPPVSSIGMDHYGWRRMAETGSYIGEKKMMSYRCVMRPRRS